MALFKLPIAAVSVISKQIFSVGIEYCSNISLIKPNILSSDNDNPDKLTEHTANLCKQLEWSANHSNK